MNQTVVIVKSPGKRREWSAIRIHWDEGEKVEKWLGEGFGSWGQAWELIQQGHRSTILQPHEMPDQCPEHWGFRTLRDAIAHCEHNTLAVHNGKGWRITHGHG
jgi:hypothetical protein